MRVLNKFVWGLIEIAELLSAACHMWNSDSYLDFFTDFIDLIFEKPETETLVFIRAFEKLDISIPTMRKAAFHFLSLILSYKPVTKGNTFINI